MAPADVLPPPSLALPGVVAQLDRAWREFAQHQDPNGGYRLPFSGWQEAGHTSTTLLAAAGSLLQWAIAQGVAPPSVAESQGDLAERTARAWAFAHRALRPTGRMDLRGCNFDSGPDTGFATQLACAVVDLGADRTGAVAAFAQATLPGLVDGGFHTPNHRWVLASALAWARHLWPDSPGAETVRALVAEGPDADANGLYPERSPGIYDAVTNRSLLLLHEFAAMPGAFDAVRRNLRFDLPLLRDDGTVCTLLSHRQDGRQRILPLALAQCFLQLDRLEAPATGPWRAVAALLAGQTQRGTTREALSAWFWLAWQLLRHPLAHRESAPFTPPSFIQQGPIALWRGAGWQCAAAQQALWADFAIAHGVQLRAVTLSACWFGIGQAIAQNLSAKGAGEVNLSDDGRRPGTRLPCYYLPLGEPVAPEGYYESLDRRPVRALPPLGWHWQGRALAHGQGVAWSIASVGGLDGVPGHLAFDFAPGTHLHWRPAPGAPSQPAPVIWQGDGEIWASVPDSPSALVISVVAGGSGVGGHTDANPRETVPPPQPAGSRCSLALVTPVALQIFWEVRATEPA